MSERTDSELQFLHFDLDHPPTIEIPDVAQSVYRVGEGGREVFSLRTGKDYFRRYAMLGEPHCIVTLDRNGELVGNFTLVKRQVAGHEFWLGDDGKILERFRGRHTLAMMRYYRGVIHEMLKGAPLFGAVIVGEGNRADEALMRFYSIAFGSRLGKLGRLCELTLTAEQFAIARPLIEKHRGPITGYLSLAGIRDFAVNDIAHTNCLQVQYGPLARCNANPADYANPTFSFLSPEDDGMTRELLAAGLSPFMRFHLLGTLPLDPIWLLGQDI